MRRRLTDSHAGWADPALALASTSTVKVSEGFEKMEWEGTAMKLKINEGQDRPHFMPKSAAREKMDKAKEKMKDVTDEAMRTMRRKAKPDIEGTEFKDVAFSPSVNAAWAARSARVAASLGTATAIWRSEDPWAIMPMLTP